MPRGERKPRSYFTKKLERLLSDLDGNPEREYRFNNATFYWYTPEYAWVRSRVQSIWVCGSYSRGAAECGDLDLIVEFQTDDPKDGAVGRPRDRETINAFWPRMRGVQFHIGSPEKNSGKVKFPEAILIWKPGFDWRAAIGGIKESDTAGRFSRVSDEFPIDHIRLGLRIDEVEELVYAKRASIIDWLYVPIDIGCGLDCALSGEEERARRFIERTRGKDANALIIPMIIAIRSLRKTLVPKGMGWNSDGFKLEWSGFDVQLGNLHTSVDALGDKRSKGVIVAPYIRKKSENGLLVLRRGDRYAEGLAKYKEEEEARWNKSS